jgi:hypothetical protein
VASAERFWTRRLRWRLLGAWRWPAFAVFTLVDAALLNRLGLSVTFNIPVSLILASFGNIGLLIAADLLARFTARQRAARGIPTEPAHLEVTIDRGGVALLVAGAIGLAVVGASTHHLVIAETDAREREARAVRDWINAHAPEEYKQSVEAGVSNTFKLKDDYFRTCVANADRDRFICLFVDTSKEPTEVKRDRSREPNPADAP